MTQNTILSQWKTLEHEPRNIPFSFYLFGEIFVLAVIVYALATNSPVMAITFILIGIMTYVTLEKTPETIQCAITSEGIIMDKEIYVFENIESFWIVHDDSNRHISVKTTGKLTPFIKIPLGQENPIHIREILLKYAKEEKHDPTLIDIIEKMLHIE